MNIAKTLFVSDLDGTILNSQGKLSAYTREKLQLLLPEINITFATARDFHAGMSVLNDIDLNLPLIVANGAFIYDPIRKRNIFANYHQTSDLLFLQDLFQENYFYTPQVHAHINGFDRISFITEKLSEGNIFYLNRAANKSRFRKVAINDYSSLFKGDVYCINLIAEYDHLLPIYDKLKQLPQFFIILQQELYRPEWWLAVYPVASQKSHALAKLKEYLNIDYVVAFGDTTNDANLFKEADYKIAVNNADIELKNIADTVIGDNDSDAVINYIYKLWQT